MKNHRVGPAHIFLGDPTQASGAGMQYMGATRGDVTVNPNIGVATGREDQKGRTPVADGVFVTGPTPVASLPLIDEEKAKLQKVLPGSTVTGTALGLGSGFSKIAESAIPTLCILPIDQVGQGTNGIDATDAIWFPAAISTDFGNLVFNLPDGDDIFNPHEVQVAALLREKDQDSPQNSIPSEAQVMFIGSPNQFTGIDSGQWSLPAATP